jgi:CPA2 family monovalent cation:H+ antiporter-2
MHDMHEFLKSLTIVLAVAAVTTVLFQRLRQPVVLGYIIAGLIVGPHVPIPLVADPAIVRTLSELGVILLMFFLGLEFSLAKLVRVGPTAGVTAVIQTGLMAWLGFLAGRLLGWTPLESVFTGAIVAILSTTIIAKVFDEYGIGGRLRELVVGVLLFEDLIAIVFMAVLTAVATGVVGGGAARTCGVAGSGAAAWARYGQAPPTTNQHFVNGELPQPSHSATESSFRSPGAHCVKKLGTVIAGDLRAHSLS